MMSFTVCTKMTWTSLHEQSTFLVCLIVELLVSYKVTATQIAKKERCLELDCHNISSDSQIIVSLRPPYVILRVMLQINQIQYGSKNSDLHCVL